MHCYCVAGDQPGADIGPLISPQAKQRVIDLVESGVKDGASLLMDGRGIVVPGYEKGNFVGPTLLHNVKVRGCDSSVVTVICYLCSR